MRFPSRRLALLAAPVLLPGLILAYLSFRSVKDERLLLEKSQEASDAAFADAFEDVLRKTRQASFDRLRADLAQGGRAQTPLEAWALAARLQENPLIHSVVIFRDEEPVFPPLPRDHMPVDSLETPPAMRRTALERIAREEWAADRPALALRALRILLHGPDSLGTGSAREAEARFGFRLLELKSLLRLDTQEEAVPLARALVHDLLASSVLESHHRAVFYLSEIAELMTTRENLPRDARGEFFALHQRMPAFLTNAEAVARDWPDTPEEILRSQPFAVGDSLRVRYHGGFPYLLVSFPWLESGTQALARLDEGVFTAALHAELGRERRGAWRDAGFSVFDPAGAIVLGEPSPRDREPALERSLEDQFPAWRLVVYKRPAEELMAQGRRRILLQYALLGFSLISLLAGLVALFKGIGDAQRLVGMKANFLSAVSHELKTPLTAIRMFSEMMASGRVPPEKSVQYAGRIGTEAERLQGMIEDILAYTRLEEDTGALRPEDLDLSAVARESSGLLAEAFERAGIRLTVRLAARAPLHADYNAMRSLVQNLLENALKYSRTGTETTLEVAAGNEEIVLRVADQGIGIAAADQKRVFERFYRSGDEMTRRTRGSGLGLALVKRIADAHGASIRLNSREGEGTEMIVSFPRKA